MLTLRLLMVLLTVGTLAAVGSALKDVLRPILEAPPAEAATGFEGNTLYADTADRDTLFYDSLSGQPLTVAEAIRVLNGIINSLKGQVTDLSVEVGQLASKLASTGQNDIALALRNMNDLLRQVQTTQRSLEDRVAALEG